MGRYSNRWWSYAKRMIRDYPALRVAHDDLKEQKIIAQYGEEAGGRMINAISDPTATAALQQMDPYDEKEYEAVHNAIEETLLKSDGRLRMAMVEMVLMYRTHTIKGAALQLHYSERTLQEWHREFIHLVARYRQLRK